MKNHKIQVAGKSGCPIKINENKVDFTLTKAAKSVTYSPRLKKQAEKQNEFYISQTDVSPFKTPKIIRTFEEEGIYTVEMEFVNVDSYSNYLLKQSKNSLDTFISNLHNYLATNINQSTKINHSVFSQLITNKIEELANNFNKSTFKKADELDTLLSYLKNNIPLIDIPIGQCHGDFTLSNMLFANNSRIYLIDFLDSFLESPFIDYVKLRQDTRFYWSAYLEKEDIKLNVRLIQVLNYIDKEISNKIRAEFKDIVKWEDYLTVMNLARIIPYAETKEDFDFITKHINIIIK
jgi:hypothetical protein